MENEANYIVTNIIKFLAQPQRVGTFSAQSTIELDTVMVALFVLKFNCDDINLLILL